MSYKTKAFSLSSTRETASEREASPLSARMDKGLQSGKTSVTLVKPGKWTSELTGQDNEGCFTLVKVPISQQDGAVLYDRH